MVATAPDGSTPQFVYDAVGRLAALSQEAGNEVIIAFEHGEARQPLLIGFLWGGGDSVTLTGSGQVRACVRCP